MEGGWWFWALPQPTSTVDFHYAPIQYSHYIECMVCLMPSILDRYCWWKPHVSLDRIIIAWDHHYLFHLAAFAKWSSKWHLRGKSCWWQRERERERDALILYAHKSTYKINQRSSKHTHMHIYNYTYIHNISLNHLFIWDRSMQNTVESCWIMMLPFLLRDFPQQRVPVFRAAMRPATLLCILILVQVVAPVLVAKLISPGVILSASHWALPWPAIDSWLSHDVQNHARSIVFLDVWGAVSETTVNLDRLKWSRSRSPRSRDSWHDLNHIPILVNTHIRMDPPENSWTPSCRTRLEVASSTPKTAQSRRDRGRGFLARPFGLP